MTQATIVWLRSDLRLHDHPALLAAAARGGPVVPVFIHCDAEQGEWGDGAASRWWLHHSLAALDASLRKIGSRLTLLRGHAATALEQVISQTGATAVYWSRRYEPAGVEQDANVRTQLERAGVTVQAFNSALLCEPASLLNQDGKPYRVYTAFKRRVLDSLEGTAITTSPAPRRLAAPRRWPTTLTLDAFELMPHVDWYGGLADAWTSGETAALTRARRFLRSAIAAYRVDRDHPATDGTSRLSPHLHFGELSARRLWRMTMQACVRQGMSTTQARDSSFISELIWREFAHHQLHHFPHTTNEPLDRRFDRWRWNTEKKRLRAWQQGQTGYPIVDAGMRQLWATGWMHNRVRMIVASFLTKNLQIHWLDGARWFWDTLVDADLAANTLNWQWVAGCGADAAPYFRIFNPITQGEKFDADGAYVRRWVPELAGLPARYLHAPWEAPPPVLAAANVRIGDTYPAPIVDLRSSREAALAAYHGLARAPVASS